MGKCIMKRIGSMVLSVVVAFASVNTTAMAQNNNSKATEEDHSGDQEWNVQYNPELPVDELLGSHEKSDGSYLIFGKKNGKIIAMDGQYNYVKTLDIDSIEYARGVALKNAMGTMNWLQCYGSQKGFFVAKKDEKLVLIDENLNEKGTGYHAELIPTRGTWIEFENSLKGMVYVDIDHSQNASHKMPATVLFKALGFSEKNILDLFGDSDEIKSTIAKDKDCKTSNDALIEIFKKLKPGEPVTKEGTITFLVQRFFDEKRYDLGRAGRFKINQKLGIYNRLVGRILAEPLIDANGEIATNENGEPFMEGYTLTKEDVEHLRDIEFFENGAMEQDLGNYINPAFAIGSTKVNVVKVHAFDKKSEPIVKIVGTDLNLAGVKEGSHTLLCLAVPDIVACYSYFENVQVGIGSLDDIDNLGNRRVRCVGADWFDEDEQEHRATDEHHD